MPEQALNDFGNVAGFYQFDDPNKKTLELKVHLRGCKNVFLVVSDSTEDRCVACFKLPDEDGLNTMRSYNRELVRSD